MEVGVGLVHDLEIRLLGDALPGDRGAELVVHDLDLLVDEHVGQLEGRVRDRVFDDLVGELVARPVERVPLQPRLDVGPQRGEVREVAHLVDELVVELRQDLLAQLLELDREVDGRAGQLRLAVVLGEGDVELGGAARLQPDEVGLEARDQAFLPEDQRHALRGAALERGAVAGADEPDDGVVAVLGAALLDGRQGRVLVAQLVDDLVDAGVVDGLDLRPEVEVPVVAELDLRADLDRGLEDERLALLGLHDLDVGIGQREDLLLDQRLAVGVLDEVLDRVVEDGARPERALEDLPGGLARAEAGDTGPAREVLHGVLDRLVQALRGQLDLELDGRLGGGRRRDLHRGEV